MNNAIFLKSGFLSAYGFMCGYIQKCENSKFEVQLYKESLYHVRVINITETSRSVDVWNSYGTLTEAKKDYFKQISNTKS